MQWKATFNAWLMSYAAPPLQPPPIPGRPSGLGPAAQIRSSRLSSWSAGPWKGSARRAGSTRYFFFFFCYPSYPRGYSWRRPGEPRLGRPNRRGDERPSDRISSAHHVQAQTSPRSVGAGGIRINPRTWLVFWWRPWCLSDNRMWQIRLNMRRAVITGRSYNTTMHRQCITYVNNTCVKAP